MNGARNKPAQTYLLNQPIFSVNLSIFSVPTLESSYFS